MQSMIGTHVQELNKETLTVADMGLGQNYDHFLSILNIRGRDVLGRKNVTTVLLKPIFRHPVQVGRLLGGFP